MFYSFGGIPVYDAKQYASVIRGVISAQRTEMQSLQETGVRTIDFEAPKEWVRQLLVELGREFTYHLQDTKLFITFKAK